MNNSSFLSDNINFNKEYNKIGTNHTFISDNNFNKEYNKKNKSYSVKNYQAKTNEKCVIKSATSKKWSIKFK